MPYAADLGLIERDLCEEVKEREVLINIGIDICSQTKLHARVVNEFLKSVSSSPIDSSETISKLCKRPELELKDILNLDGLNNDIHFNKLLNDETALRQVEIELKYEGYIKRQEKTIDRIERYEELNIPLTLNYLILNALSAEAKEKLDRIKPRSVGQASRISGVTPSDISILLVYLKK
jgi:tRNA uridine 5-carboxymethylaminomethyl modification enzyme